MPLPGRIDGGWLQLAWFDASVEDPPIRFKFAFRLTPLPQVPAWGDPPHAPRLHWFGLTDGTYSIEVPGTELLVYSAPGAVGDEPGTSVEYPVVRLWEDLLEWAPRVLEAVPDDLVAFVENKPVASMSDLDVPGDEVAIDTLVWHDEHRLDLGYLQNPPRIHAWRGGRDDLVTLTWEQQTACGVKWAAPASGRFQLSPEAFRAAVVAFDSNLMVAMDARVAQVSSGALPEGVHIDIGHLRREHEDRRTWLVRGVHAPEPVDWGTIRDGVQVLDRIAGTR